MTVPSLFIYTHFLSFSSRFIRSVNINGTVYSATTTNTSTTTTAIPVVELLLQLVLPLVAAYARDGC